MSVNCIHTKLVGSATNNNLPRLGQLYFKPGAAGTYRINVAVYNASNPVILSVKEGSIKYESGNPAPNPETFASDSSRDFVADNGNSEFIIDNKYNISKINFPCNLKDIAACPQLKEFGSNTASYAFLYGDISDVADTITLERINCGNNAKIAGNISSLGKLINLTYLYFRGCNNVEGNIEDMIAGMIANGRTSATKETGITFISLIGQEKIKFNGSRPSTNGYFVWEAGQIAGQYVITYKDSSDDSTISSVTVTVQ